jgi:HAD superfamily hydrolase (TIGR01509 family)
MRPELIIFDCDGVLIDSEGVASRVVAENLSALGWRMTADEAQKLFLGMSIYDMEPMIEARMGVRLPGGWKDGLAGELSVALAREARLIPGAREMLERVNLLGIDWRVASNSSHAEMAVKFGRTGFLALTDGRIHAAADLRARGGRPKPAPDVFLDAAARAGVAPGRCLVVEDSALGVTGAVAAGMVCFGYAPHDDGAALLQAGAKLVLRELDEIFGLIEGVFA